MRGNDLLPATAAMVSGLISRVAGVSVLPRILVARITWLVVGRRITRSATGVVRIVVGIRIVIRPTIGYIRNVWLAIAGRTSRVIIMAAIAINHHFHPETVSHAAGAHKRWSKQHR